MLFEYAADYAKIKDASSIQLDVWEFNKNTVKLYKKWNVNGKQENEIISAAA